MRGLLLGFANGTVCLAYCAPVLVPYLLGEGTSWRRNALTVLQFLSGRLAGYLVFAVGAWLTGSFLLSDAVLRELLIGVADVGLGGLLLLSTLRKPHERCAANAAHGLLDTVRRRWPGLLPICFGLLTGVNLCPPFVLIFTEAANTPDLLHSIGFFWMFFLGTSLYFLPLPLLGILKHHAALQTVGKLSALLMAGYYIVVGGLIVGGHLV